MTKKTITNKTVFNENKSKRKEIKEEAIMLQKIQYEKEMIISDMDEYKTVLTSNINALKNIRNQINDHKFDFQAITDTIPVDEMIAYNELTIIKIKKKLLKKYNKELKISLKDKIASTNYARKIESKKIVKSEKDSIKEIGNSISEKTKNNSKQVLRDEKIILRNENKMAKLESKEINKQIRASDKKKIQDKRIESRQSKVT
jgi:hypothetical protein